MAYFRKPVIIKKELFFIPKKAKCEDTANKYNKGYFGFIASQHDW